MLIFLSDKKEKPKTLRGLESIKEPENLQAFLYDHKNELIFYKTYRLFDPYGFKVLEIADIKNIKDFSKSLYELADTFDLKKENKTIRKYNLSTAKIKKYSQALQRLSDLALKDDLSMISLGD